ncbi:MAG: hypothetical protein F6K28_25570 [Microcoleus sp. SIO2G3]|nr:hypothetical protein [Microcoleus sp. SIO2G3]
MLGITAIAAPTQPQRDGATVFGTKLLVQASRFMSELPRSRFFGLSDRGPPERD